MGTDFRLFDWEGNFLCNAGRWLSLDWELLYNDVGTFEGHFEPDSRVVDCVLAHPYLIAIHGDHQAIVTGYLAGEDFAVYGRTLNWILTRNVLQPYAESSQTVEAHARKMVGDTMAHVSNFELGEVAGYSAVKSYATEEPGELFGHVQDVLNLDGAGHMVRYDVATKKWIFKVLKGVTRDKILSPAYNLYGQEVNYDMLDMYNAGWYEQEAPEPAEGEQKGDPVWTHIEGAKTGIYQFDTILSGKTNTEAGVDLGKKTASKAYSAMLRGLDYGKDYALGDTLRMQFQIGKYRETIEKKVVGVNLSYTTHFEQQPILEG